MGAKRRLEVRDEPTGGRIRIVERQPGDRALLALEGVRDPTPTRSTGRWPAVATSSMAWPISMTP